MRIFEIVGAKEERLARTLAAIVGKRLTYEAKAGHIEGKVIRPIPAKRRPA